MRSMVRATFLFVAVTTVLLVGCTGILGDFTVSPGGSDAGTDAPATDGPVSDGSPGDGPAEAGCPANQQLCNGVCVPLTDPANCGSCSNACPATAPLCTAGPGGTFSCETGCSGPTPDLCGGTCTNLQQDPNNCITCGTMCPVPQNGVPTCSPSGCGFVCSPKYHLCNGACVSDSDVNSCGASCSPCVVQNGSAACTSTGTGYVCSIGGCNNGFADCGNAVCQDVTSDPNNCGGCGNTCGAPMTACMNQACACPTGTPTFCSQSNACVDTTSDAFNCGQCGFACTGGQICGQGTCVCPGTKPNLCGNTCVNTSSDPNNCGGCGHKCLGGACTNGQCQAVDLATLSTNATAIASDGNNIYFGESSGHVYKCPVSGCGAIPALLATLPASAYPKNFFYDFGSNLLWLADPNNGVVYGINPTNGTAVFKTTATYSQAAGVFTDATYVYFGYGASIMRVSKVAAPPATASTWATLPASTWVSSLTFDPNTAQLAWGSYDSTGHVGVCPTTGTAPVTCTSVGDYPYVMGVTVSGSHLFAVDRGSGANVGGVFTWSIASASLTGWQAVASATSAPGPYTSLNGNITSDANNLYWGADNGSVVRCAVAGCGNTPTPIASDGSVNAITNDGAAVYWADNSGVWKVAK